MKVLHYSPHMQPGSPSVLAADLACALQAAGCENIVIAPTGELLSRLHTGGVTHISCHRPNMLTAWREIRRLRKTIRRQAPDVVQVYSADAAWVVSMACRNGRSKVTPPMVGAMTGYAWPGAAELGWNRCDALTAISRHQREVVTSDQALQAGTPWVIPYGTDESLCYPGYAPTENWYHTWRRQQPEYVERLSICVPGAITPLHGLEDIAPILTGLLQAGITAQVYITGDIRKARTAYVQELKNLYADAGLSDYITWLGHRTDLRDVLCACDITLSLSRKPATWDRAVQEALSLGRPVVGYDHGVVGEYLSIFLPEGRVAPGDIAGVLDTLSQWSVYPPTPIQEIPYPYRLTDTAATYLRLYNEITKQTP